ncbi:MAG: YceD family protein [Fimbriimonadaceae bacterium]
MKRSGLLDLNEVLQYPGKTLSAELSVSFDEEEDIDLIRPVEGTLNALSTGNLLLLTGQFRGAAVLECARCSYPIEVPIEFEIEEQFPVEGIPSSYGAQDYARVVPDEPEKMFEGNSLIVTPFLRQGLLLSLPTQPLCSFGWEGPCPHAEGQPSLRLKAEGRFEFQKLRGLIDPEDSTS